MKFAFPEIEYVFDTNDDRVNSLIIENQCLFLSFITDLQNQLNGFEGKAVLSDDSKILPISKNLEVLDRFVPFDINSKSITARIAAELEKKAFAEEFIAEQAQIIGEIDSFLSRLAFDFSCDVQFAKVNISSIIKASGVEIKDDYEKLGEKLIDYFQLISEFVGRKLFITVNLRSFLSDSEAELFIQTILSHRYNVIMIESFEHRKLKKERRVVVDSDLCLIS